MKQRFSFIAIAFVLLLLPACQNNLNHNGEEGKAIVLGDTTTIVTETVDTYLNDKVADINPKEFAKAAIAAASSPEMAEVPKWNSSSISGFSINFGQGVKMIFSEIKTREFQDQNPQKDAGVSYAVVAGDLVKSNIRLIGLKNIEIKARYQTYLIVKSGDKKLSLQNMGGYLSDWKDLKLTNNNSGDVVIPIKNLKKLKFKNVSHNTLRRAVKRAANSSRLSKQQKEDWLKKIRRTQSANDRPCQIKLSNVQWRISGETKDGQSFFKTVRIDT